MEQANKEIGRNQNKKIEHKIQYEEPPFNKSKISGEQKIFNKNKQNTSKKIENIKEASVTAKDKLAEALDKKANNVVSVSKEGENWQAIVEIIDEEYLPGKNLNSMSDIIGIYEVKLSNNGELTSWTKKSTRKRGYTSA